MTSGQRLFVGIVALGWATLMYGVERTVNAECECSCSDLRRANAEHTVEMRRVRTDHYCDMITVWLLTDGELGWPPDKGLCW